MTHEWPIVPLGQLIDPSRGISYGIVQPGPHVPGGVPIIRAGDLRGNRIDISSPLRVAKSVENNYIRTRLRGGELVMSIVGTVGQTAIIQKELEGWNTARAVAVIPVISEVGAYWVEISLRTPEAQARINSRLNTTVQATLNLRDLAEIPIPLPPRPVRQAIGSVLAALDAKMRINEHMNNTLEDVSSSVFQDWFVDFGPTKSKAVGGPPYLPPNDWAVFPARLEDSAPKGWRHYSLEELVRQQTATIAPNLKADTEFEHYSIPAYDAHRSPSIDLGSAIKSNKTIVPPNAILLSKLNPEIPRVWIVEAYQGRQQICSTEFLAFTPANGTSRSLLFGLFTNGEFREMLRTMATGTSTSHQRVSPSELLSTKVLYATQDLFRMYENIAEPLIKKVLANYKENRSLVSLREYLLPNLMSGKIRVRDAEKLVGNIA